MTPHCCQKIEENQLITKTRRRETEREKKERPFEKSPMYVSLLTFLNVRYAVTVTQHGESSTHIVIRITNVTSRIKREQYERWYSETVTSRL